MKLECDTSLSCRVGTLSWSGVINEEVIEIWKDLQYDKRKHQGDMKKNDTVRNKKHYCAMSVALGEGKERYI